MSDCNLIDEQRIIDNKKTIILNGEKKTRYFKVETISDFEYFNQSGGGNNRKWAKRFEDMINGYRTLKEQKPKVSKYYLEGYKRCMDIFRERDSLIVRDNE
jgi:hypothetical protein